MKYKNLLRRRRLRSYVIARKLKEILRIIANNNLTMLLTKGAKSVSSENMDDEVEMAAFSLTDYRKLIDASTDIKYRIDESMTLMRILKKINLSEKLPARYYKSCNLATLLTNYKHYLSPEGIERVKFKLSNSSFNINICPILFNYLLDILTTLSLENGSSTTVCLSFDAPSRTVYIEEDNQSSAEHINHQWIAKQRLKFKNKPEYRFVNMILQDVGASIDYGHIATNKIGFVIKYPVSK